MSADDVIARLNEAKTKLTNAKRIGLEAASIVDNAYVATGHALKRQGLGSPLMEAIEAKKLGLRDRSVEIDALVKGVEKAIAQVEEIGEGSSAGDGSGPS